MQAYDYFKDFGISQSKYQQCIDTVAEESNTSSQEVTDLLTEYLGKITTKCINKTAKSNKPLKEYQELAVKHMLTHRGMIAAFDVGTGKTLTAVAVAHCLIQIAKFINVPFQVIIVTPTSLQGNFKKELRAVGLNPKNKSFSFYTTTLFAKAVKNGDLDCSNKLVIIDEAHVFRSDYRGEFRTIPISKKNTRAELAVRCAAQASKVLLLTATPIYNRTYDLVNLISMVKGIDPPYSIDPQFEQSDGLLSRYCDAILFQKSSVEDFPRRKDILYKIQMEGEYEKEYRELLEAIRTGAEFQGKEAKNAFMTKVRAASNNISTCVKCDHAMKIIKKALEKDERVLLFSEFKSSGVNLMINNLKDEGIDYYLIDGSTARKKRDKYVKDFNSPTGNKVIIITKAGGEGLDLKKVMHVILFEKGWNISGQEQVIGRAIRYLSHSDLPLEKRVVNVWHLITLLPEEYDALNIPQLKEFETIDNRTTIAKQDVDANADVMFSRVSKSFSILENVGGITIPSSLLWNFMHKFNNRQKPNIKKVLESFNISYKEPLDDGIKSADAYMFLQAIKKDTENKKLAAALQSIQIGTVECGTELLPVVESLPPVVNSVEYNMYLKALQEMDLNNKDLTFSMYQQLIKLQQ